jgi:hypothetical protein
MTSKSLALALAASTASWSCSPVANPIVEASSSPLLDAAGGAAGAPDTDGSGSDGRVGDATTDVGLSQMCGNGDKEGDEYCDDFMNPTPGFGCTDDCTASVKAACGDGVVTSPEVCDGPAAYCENCTKILGSCGDGSKQANEDCDSKGESATCNANCTLVRCGDRIVNRTAKEACDDGVNDGQPGSCATDCTDYASKSTEAEYASCKDLLAAKAAAGQTLRSGLYWLKGKDMAAYIAYCDAVSDGGGWTLVMRAIESNFDYYDALWSNTTLENENVFDFISKKTRSKYRAYVEVSFTEMRTSELLDTSVSYVASVMGEYASAQAFFGVSGGEGASVTIGLGPDALEDYFNARAVFDDRQWGCTEFIAVGFNQHLALHVTDTKSNSLGPDSKSRCDWDGGARFGQRVNTCHYSTTDHQCSGNHGGQGWGNFKNNPLPLKAKPISQLLWVR